MAWGNPGLDFIQFTCVKCPLTTNVKIYCSLWIIGSPSEGAGESAGARVRFLRDRATFWRERVNQRVPQQRNHEDPSPSELLVTRSLKKWLCYHRDKRDRVAQTLHKHPLIHPLPPKVTLSLRILEGAGYLDVRSERAFNACALLW